MRDVMDRWEEEKKDKYIERSIEQGIERRKKG